jgi:hypothetical protein
LKKKEEDKDINSVSNNNIQNPSLNNILLVNQVALVVGKPGRAGLCTSNCACLVVL